MIFLIIALFTMSMVQAIYNPRPVIGVITQPRKEPFPYEQYILRQNLIINELAGARTVPIYFDSTPEELDERLSTINGVHFTGGGLHMYDDDGNMHQYLKTTIYIMKWAMKKNDEGIVFPLVGICQGLEAMHLALSQVPGGLAFTKA
jgi:gamma-glutamyl hydrolase